VPSELTNLQLGAAAANMTNVTNVSGIDGSATVLQLSEEDEDAIMQIGALNATNATNVSRANGSAIVFRLAEEDEEAVTTPAPTTPCPSNCYPGYYCDGCVTTGFCTSSGVCGFAPRIGQGQGEAATRVKMCRSRLPYGADCAPSPCQPGQPCVDCANGFCSSAGKC